MSSINISLLMRDNPYAANGAAAYMRRLYLHKDLAVQNGISDVTLCHGGVNFTNTEKYAHSMRSRLKDTIRQQLIKTRLGTKITMNLINCTRSQNAIHMFESLQTIPEAVIFNDFFVHDLFMKKYPNYSGLKVQVLHNNGEPGKMIRLVNPNIDRRWVEDLEKRILSSSDVIVFVGAKNKMRFDLLHPEYANKSVHVHLGIDDMGVNPNRGKCSRLTFITVGTICSRKNQQVLMDVAQDNHIASHMQFIVVGGGEQYEFCKTESVKRGLSEIVKYVGPSSNVVEYYRQADALLSVSLDEGLPTVALEAMSCGLPLALTDVGGCSELINGNGVLIPTCDTLAIINGVKRFFQLLSAGEISGAVSRSMFERCYTTEAMWGEYAELIEKRLTHGK